MKRTLLLTIVIVAGIIACGGNKHELVVLDPGTPAYELGKVLAEKVPALDPDSNRVIMTANAFSISAGEILQNLKNNLGKQTEQLKTLGEPQIKANVRQIAERLALQKALWAAARKAGYGIDEAKTDSILNIFYARTGGKEAYEKILEDNGVTLDFIRHEIGVSNTIEAYITAVEAERSAPSEEELKEAYEQSQQDTLASVRHILLLTQEKSDSEKAEIRKKMEMILTRARQGEDFAKLAAEYSEDPGSKENGGLYENFDRETMVPPFTEAAFSVPVGEISGIVETTYGYHILKIVDRGVNKKSFAESKDELKDKIARTKGASIIPEFIDELKQEAGIAFVGW
ncbi:peptidylprolyl isomerase [bacterium]|nr:peptidylprolyl isomerase [bacterium]